MGNCVDCHSRALSQTKQNSKCIENKVQWIITCRWQGFKPWSLMIPHATEQLSSCATTTEYGFLEPLSHKYRARVLSVLMPVGLEPVLHKGNHSNEKPMHLTNK